MLKDLTSDTAPHPEPKTTTRSFPDLVALSPVYTGNPDASTSPCNDKMLTGGAEVVKLLPCWGIDQKLVATSLHSAISKDL